MYQALSQRASSTQPDLVFGGQADAPKDTEENLGRPPTVESTDVSGHLSNHTADSH